MEAEHGAPARRPARVAVLGGTGFLGHQICTTLLDHGHEVLAIARQRKPAHCHRAYRCDLRAVPVERLTDLLDAEGVGAVVNATGAVWQTSETEMVDKNVRLVEHLVDAVSRMRNRPRYIQLGTVHEYATLPEGQALDENAPTVPRNVYGRTKLAGSRAVLTAARTGRLDGVVLRLSNVAGPRTSPSSLLGRVVARLAEGLRADRPPAIELSPLRAYRDFVDLRDVADAVVAALGRPVSGRVFNIGSGVAVSVRSAVEALIEISGVPAELIERPDLRSVRDGSEWLQVDTGAAWAALGWAPSRSLSDSLKALWEDAARGC